MALLASLVLAAAVVWSALAVTRELRALRSDIQHGRVQQLLNAFAPGIAAARDNPRALLTWQPLAVTARSLMPEDFAALDRAAGSTFPFNADQIQAAHSKWTADWLAWERAHDTEYKLKAAAAERDLRAPGSGLLERARADTVEHDKLDAYQRRYEEYIRVAKALQALQEHAR